MILYYYLNNDLRKGRDIDSHHNGLIIYYFYQLVEDDYDWVISFAFPIGGNR